MSKINCSQDGVFRTPKTSYAIVSNTALRDTSLSIKSRGLYAIIKSYITIAESDPTYKLYKSFLMEQSDNDGLRSFTTAWNELKEKGYLKQYRIRIATGFTYEYELLDEPDTSTPGTINIKYDGTVSNDDNKNTVNLDIEAEFDEGAYKALQKSATKSDCPTYSGLTKEEFTENVKKQIDYDSFKDDELHINKNLFPGLIDDILNIIVDTFFSNEEHINIRKTKQSITTVRSVFSKLEPHHIEQAIKAIKEYIDDGNTIKNAHGFIVTTLYDTYETYGTKSYQEYG